MTTNESPDHGGVTAGRGHLEEAGWYPDPSGSIPERLRFWNGESWTEEWALRTAPATPVPARRLTGSGPMTNIAVGIVFTLVGAAFYVGGSDAGVDWPVLIGVVLMATGLVNLSIGVIARGVQIGLREHHFDFWS